MFDLLKRKSIPETPPPGGYDADTCRRLLSEQLDYIARVCEKAAGNADNTYRQSFAGEGGHGYLVERLGQLDKDELYVQVLDHLKEDDFRRLRAFQGRSSFTTYLTQIINRLVVDIVRERTGRNRAKERAERHGDLGRHVYDLMVRRGHTAEESSDILLTNFCLQTSIDDLTTIHSSLLGRDSRHQSCSGAETAWGEGGELVVIKNQNPEDELMSHTQNDRRCAVLSKLVDCLNGEDRLLMRLRFPFDDDAPPLNMEQIAAMTGLTYQQVDRKIRRILLTCREELLSKGISLEDLL